MRPFFAALLVAVLAGIVSAHAERRVALVIGNNAYENLTRLNNPAVDAERLSGILAAHGFEVMSCDGARPGCYDLDRAALTDALEDFRDLADGATLALMFYAGHGLQTDEGNVLAPTDMELSCGNWRARRKVLLDDVLDAMKGAEQKIVILDACRNDPFKAQQCLERGARPLSFDSFAVPDSAARFLLMTSTRNGQLAQDGVPGAHSPFAEALFHWMEEEPLAPFAQLLDRVTKRVIERTTAANFTQIPEILIRGGAPEACLMGGSCSSDPQAVALRVEVETLRRDNLRNQELAEIGAAYIRSAGLDGQQTLSPEDRQRILDGIAQAGRALIARNDGEAEYALAQLRTGNETAAEALFSEVLQTRAATPDASDEMDAAKRKEAADAARHIAALAWPKDVGKAARYFGQAAELDSGDVQTWMNYAYTSRDAGDTAQALRAFRSASALARDSSQIDNRIWAAFGQGDITSAQGRLDLALDFYTAAARISGEYVQDHPDDLYANRNYSVAHERIGNVKLSRGDLRGALQAFRLRLDSALKLAEAEPGNTLFQRDLSVAYGKVGEILQTQGNLAAALEAFDAGAEPANRLAASDPANTEWQSDLAYSLTRIGSVRMARGDLDAALDAFRQALAIREELITRDPNNTNWRFTVNGSLWDVSDAEVSLGRLADAMVRLDRSRELLQELVASDPNNAVWRRDYSVVFNRIGDIRVAQGDLAAALRAFTTAEKIISALAEANPDNLGWQRDHALSFEKIGDVLVAQGNLAGALNAFNQRAAMAGRLADQDPANTIWRRDLSNAHERIGRIRTAMGDLQGGLAAHREMLAIREDLVASDPDNANWRFDLYAALWYVADAEIYLGYLEPARLKLERAHDIIAGLAASNPGNAIWRRDVTVALNRLSDIKFQQGMYNEALETLHESRAITAELVAREAGNTMWLRDLAIVEEKIGDVEFTLGDLTAARETYDRRKALAEELAAIDSGNVIWRRDLSIANEKIGNVLNALGDKAGALARHRASLVIREELSASDPLNVTWRRDVAIAREKIGDALLDLGDRDGALREFSARAEIAEQLSLSDPSNPDWQRDVAISHARFAIIYRDSEPSKAIDHLREGHRIMSELLAQHPDWTVWRNDVAWFAAQIDELQARQ